MKVSAFVPAKGTSERVPNKNLRILDGEYLFKRKLLQLLNCETIDEVWLDTESQEIIDLVQDLPVKILHRNQGLASNATDGHALFANEAMSVPDADIVVQALCTAPFLDAPAIDKAIRMLLENPSYDSALAMQVQKQYVWDEGAPAYGRDAIPNSVDLPPTTVETMSFYAVRRTDGQPLLKRFGSNPYHLNMTPFEALDVNTEEDLHLAETVCAGLRARQATHFQTVRNLLSSSLLSDVCKEMGISSMLPPELVPTSKGRILGFAKTLGLRALEKDERSLRNNAWRGIFNALDSYQFIRPGDVIVVSNAVPDRAYFGDLNATLALRSGAVGAIIDGATRDTDRVSELGFPVYAKCAYGDDIRYEGTVENMNHPIKVGDVVVRNNDIVYADNDGVCVIPGKMWPKVEKRALMAVEREARVKLNAAMGMAPRDILNSVGDF